jgi:glutamate racemase
MNPENRVLGVIRPTSEIIGDFTRTGNVGILATTGTVLSNSYRIEIKNFFPHINVFQEACPMWVPLIENNEHLGPGSDYFVKKHLENIFSRSADIDTLLLACTHYPLLKNKIMQYLPQGVKLLSQGEIIADSLADYLQRHQDLEKRCSKNGIHQFFTTDSANDFNNHASNFYGSKVRAEYLKL